jgi:thymidylate kinase
MGTQQVNRTTIVSFSGIDGAGKSTQIDALRRHFESRGLSVEIIPFWDRIAQLTSLREGAGHHIFKGEKGVGNPDKPVNRRDKNVQSWPMSMVRLGLYLLDAFATRAAVRRARHSGRDLVIFDRYIYDELANLNVRKASTRSYISFIMGIVPRPDVSYILDADPVAARARKPEYPLDFIYKNRQAYLDLTRQIKGLTVIPPGPLEDVRSDVLHHALQVSRCDDLAQAEPSIAMERAS